jgi:hypothetical protein
MPDFFKAVDQGRTAQSASAPANGTRFRADEACSWPMTFDIEGKRALERLAGELGDRSLEETVYTALELLAFAVDNDLEVESKYGRGRKKISGLWS